MQSLYDFTYEQMRDLAESFGWKKFRELQILML